LATMPFSRAIPPMYAQSRSRISFERTGIRFFVLKT
jgi:hypothetical protein